jgi:hypothetical protein
MKKVKASIAVKDLKIRKDIKGGIKVIDGGGKNVTNSKTITSGKTVTSSKLGY